MVNTNPDYSMPAEDNFTIYVFYTPKPASLSAKTVDGNEADFEWRHYYLVGSTLLDSLLFSETNVKSSRVDNLQEGGYMVKLSQNGTDTTFNAWVFIDSLKIEDIYIDNNCNYLKLTAKAQYRSSYHWYNFTKPADASLRLITNNFRMQWSADTDIRAGVQGDNNAWQNVNMSLSTTIDNPAPLKDATYSVIMTNVFNNRATAASQKVNNIAVYADFEVLRPNSDESDEYAPTSNYAGEALYKVRFRNKSINADEYLWKGYGDEKQQTVIWTETTENVDKEKEYRPGKFPVDLSIKRTSSGCAAAAPSKLLVVEPSKLDNDCLPNVFSPNGDGYNDYFKFVSGKDPVSMEYVNISVYNNNGLLVYRYNGNTKSWQGWDGRFMGDGGECKTGVYYYIINGRGWDNISYSGKLLTGAVHLFR
jgi:gliding motility-associated-like protein